MPFENNEKCFLFHLKNFCHFNIFKFLSWLFGHVGQRFGKKARIDFKVYDVTYWKLIIRIHILLNISKSKGNKTMKFVQLIGYNMSNNFLEKSYTKCCGETSPRPFCENSKLSTTLDQQFVLFYVQVGAYQNILKIRCWPLMSLKWPRTSLPAY